MVSWQFWALIGVIVWVAVMLDHAQGRRAQAICGKLDALLAAIAGLPRAEHEYEEWRKANRVAEYLARPDNSTKG